MKDIISDKISSDRAKIIINTLLSEIVDKVWESNYDEYIAWLEQEVGITKEEMDILNSEGHFPTPVIEEDRAM